MHKRDWHILIVEDIDDDVQVVSQILEHYGITTSVARDGNQCHGEEPPAYLNWDLWTGTAPIRPYAPIIYHPMKWRAWQG